MAIYAIGDIQGCYDPLRRLLDQVNFTPDKDQLWCVGDLVNRGPGSLQTLNYLKSLGSAVTITLGNHDLHFLALAHGVRAPNAKDKDLLPLLNAANCMELCQWLSQQKLLHYQVVHKQHYLMVHAGLSPRWSRQQALNLAEEVEKVLQGPNNKEFLEQMYGNEPDCWDPQLSGYTRLRVITNYFTRLRYCKADGAMDFSVKRGLDKAPKDFQPWFNFQDLKQKNKIIFGHWAALEGKTDTNNIYALDTGCVWGKCLTLMRLADKKIFTCPCH